MGQDRICKQNPTNRKTVLNQSPFETSGHLKGVSHCQDQQVHDHLNQNRTGHVGRIQMGVDFATSTCTDI